jgi:hypothetical protein
LCRRTRSSPSKASPGASTSDPPLHGPSARRADVMLAQAFDRSFGVYEESRR